MGELYRCSLAGLQQRPVKTGGRLVKHARYYWLLLAEGHLNRQLFGDMLRRIWALPCRQADARRVQRIPVKKRFTCGTVSEQCPES